MHIQVTFDIVNVQPICDYYNSHKKDDQNPLEKLDRAEGGFQIKRKFIEKTGKFYDNDANNLVKQARWTKKRLVTPTGHYTFTDEEWQLLYNAMCSVHGSDTVGLHKGLR